jgi:hypothetical protein
LDDPEIHKAAASQIQVIFRRPVSPGKSREAFKTASEESVAIEVPSARPELLL